MNKDDLIKAISEANAAYVAGIPFLTDSEYDILWKQLHSIDPTNDILYHTGQDKSNLIGLPEHKHQIFGTNKAFNAADLRIFLTRFGSKPIVLEPKYDGCAGVVTLTKSGPTIHLEGNGICGQSLSHKGNQFIWPSNLMNFQSVEILIPFSDWKDEFGANPRNVVAGWLARKHEIPPIRMTILSHNYGPLKEHYSYTGDMYHLEETLLNLYAAWSKIYPIDGIMLKVADEKDRLIAGNNGTTNNWSIAWKPPIQIKTTTVTDVEWNVSRLGRVIPTIIYEPISLCGTTNTRVTGNNATWLLDREIQKDSIIEIGKAGEIIPKILSVNNTNTNELKFGIPLLCPVCNSELTWSGVHLICGATKCIAKLIKSISYFYSAKGIKTDGISDRTIEKLLQSTDCYTVLKDRPWALLSPADYNLTERIMSVLGEKLTSNLFNEFYDNIYGKATMANFISGLGLPGLAYKTTLRLCQFLKTGQINIHIPEIAQKNFIEAVEIFQRASAEMPLFVFAKLPSSAKAIYCITGTLSISRDVMIEKMSIQGYEFSASVTRETNYLIVGVEPGKVKQEKAARYNIPIITEEQLHKILTTQCINGD